MSSAVDTSAPSSFGDMCGDLTSRVKQLKGLMLMRTASPDATTSQQLQAIHEAISRVEGDLHRVRSSVHEEKKYMGVVGDMVAALARQETALDVLRSRLPDHLPGDAAEFESRAAKGERAKAGVLVPLDVAVRGDENAAPAAGGGGGGAAARSKPKAVSPVPRMQYLDVDEFESIPQYMRGRLTREKINTSIEDLQQLVDGKYRLLSMPTSKLSDAAMRRVKEYKLVDSRDLPGQYFFITSDINRCKQLKLDASGKATLQILRHTGRIKESRSAGTVRFVILD